jgi:hypothetical protein
MVLAVLTGWLDRLEQQGRRVFGKRESRPGRQLGQRRLQFTRRELPLTVTRP